MAKTNTHPKLEHDYIQTRDAHKALAMAKEQEAYMKRLVAEGKATVERVEEVNGYRLKYRSIHE